MCDLTRAMVRRRSVTLAGALSTALASGVGRAFAQTGSTTRAIRWVVPSPPGSPIDAVARRLADRVGKELGQVIVVDNKPGAVGTIGAGEVARAAADGHTFLLTISDPLIAAQAVVKALPYDPGKSFAFVSKVATSAPALVVNGRIRARSLAELVAEVRSGALVPSYGSWGPGTIPVQVMESLGREAGISFREIPYRGGPPALHDTLAGTVDMTFAAPYVAAPLIAAGKLKALGIVGAKRSLILPNVQTFQEAGYNSFVFTNEIWIGLLGPVGIDATVHRRMAEVVGAAVRGAEVRGFLVETGFTPVGNSPADFEREYRAEAALIPKLIRDLGVVPQ